MQEHESPQILEIQKLKLEIESLKHQWWKKPSYIGAVSPIVIAILTFAAGWMSGFFDTRRGQLEQEVNALRQEYSTLQLRIKDIEAANQRLETAASSLIEARSIDGRNKNPQQQVVFQEFNEAFDALITMIGPKK